MNTPSTYYYKILIFLQKLVGKISFTTDTWTDPNQSPFMAVTAHWIEAIDEQLPSGPHKKLRLHSDLVGFHHLPGQHTGEHLAHCFLFITDRLKITGKASGIFGYLDFICGSDIMADWLDHLRQCFQQ